MLRRLLILSLLTLFSLGGCVCAEHHSDCAATQANMPGPAIRGQEDLAVVKANAEKGNKGDEANLCWRYFVGHEVKQDYVEAATWCRKAADQGHWLSQWKLGSMYEKGLGELKQDWVEAYFWYTLADTLSAGEPAMSVLNEDTGRASAHLTPDQRIMADERIVILTPRHIKVSDP